MTQLLVYESVVPLTPNRHAKHFVEVGSYAFSAKINSVPLMAVEFPAAADEYVIVFTGAKDSVIPVVLLGLRNNENLFVSGADWNARYKPAFVRRYPFVFTPSPDGKGLVLCIDEAFAGLNQEGRGEQLFGSDAKPTQYVDSVLKFSQEYYTQFRRTTAFCKKLVDLGILSEMQAQVELPNKEKISMGGFSVVDREKLKSVPDKVLGELLKSGELDLVYLHLQSLRKLSLLRERVGSDAASLN